MRSGALYEFVYRGQLADEALDQVGRVHPLTIGDLGPDVAGRLALTLLDDTVVAEASAMSIVYVAIAAFENSARKLIVSVLVEAQGEDWWEKCVSEKIRRKAESRKKEEDKVKWHNTRGGDLISYTDLTELSLIVKNNWALFEPFFPSVEWASSIFEVLTRSRNVIMHSGRLGIEDVERIGINIRDWVRQVGA